MKNFTFNLLERRITLLFALFISMSTFAQLSGTYTIPTNYPTISAFVTDLNLQGVGAGGVTLNVPAGHTELLTARIDITATGTLANPITIQKSGAGANPMLTSFVGVSTPGSAAIARDGMISLSGSDYVTIDGIDLQESAANTNETTCMEYGIGLYKSSATDGAQNNTIKNCSITLNRVSFATWNGTGNNGSSGIVILNCTPTINTPIVVTAASGANSFNKFHANTIQNCNAGVVFVGYAATSPFDLGDQGNDFGGTSAATGNNVLNFGGGVGATNPSAGLFANNQWGGFNCSFNTFNNNNGSGVNHVSTLRGIYLNPSSTSASVNINNNTVTVHGGGTTSQVSGIENSFGSTAAGNTVNIQNNVVDGDYLTATTGVFYGIYSTSSAANVNITNNTVGNFMYSSNLLTGTGAIYSIYNTGSAANLNVRNNSVDNIARFGTSGGTTIGLYLSSGVLQTIKNNTVSNISIDGTGTASAMYGIQLAGTTCVADSNSVSNLLCLKSTGTSAMYGIYNVSIPTNENYNYNTISDLTHAGTGTVYGMYFNTTTGTRTVSNNLIYNLSTAGLTIAGVGGLSSSPSIFKNKIYNITSTNVGPTVSGIFLSSLGTSGTANIYNNIIGGLNAPNASSASNVAPSVRGINITATTPTSTINVRYNSIYLNATSVGANFTTSGIFHSSNATATTANLTLNNNIVVNESAANGTGIAAVLIRSTNSMNNLNALSNRNDYYCGVPSASRLIYFDGTNSSQTLLAFQTLTTSELLSISESPNFLSTTASDLTFLHINPITATQIESGGSNFSGITNDFDGDIRAANAGYTGSGTNPDMGADEFNGTSPAPSIVLNSITPSATSQCIASSRLISVTVTTLSGTITGVNLNYAFNGVPQTPIVMVNTSGNIWEGTIPVATPANATVAWGVSATSSLPLTSTFIGTTYSDEPLTGITAAASTSSAIICSGTNVNLTALINNPSAPITYSTPVISNPTTDEDLRTVRISQGATILLNNSSAVNSLTGTLGVATGTVGGYSNFTSLGTTPITAGQTYTLFVASIDAAATFFTNYATAFIDYNRDGDFADAGEALIPATGLLLGAAVDNGNDSISVSFTVPASALDGLTRMRVSVTETGQTNAAGSTNVGYGEFEDYMISINGATPGTSTSVTSVSWSDGVGTVGTTNPLSVSPTTTTTYTATIISAGCTYAPSPSVTVTVNPLPTAPTALNSVQCGTQIPTASVTSTTGASTPTFKWYDAAIAGNVMQTSTSTTFTSNITTTTTFYVSEVNGITLCESPRTPVTITVALADGVTATTSLATICIGNPVTLTAANTNPTPNQTYTYTWSGTANSGITIPVSGGSVIVTPTLPGTYTYDLSAVDGGCNAVAQVSVTVNPFIATVSPIDVTCNGGSNGSFSLTSSACGTSPYTYSVNGGAFGAIPTNLTAGSYAIIVQDDNGYVTTSQNITVGQPSTTITNPTVTNASVCLNSASALVSATSTVSTPTPGTLIVPFDVTIQPTETNSAPGNIIATATYSLPANATVTGGTLTYNGLTALGSSWKSDIRLGFSGSVVNAAASGTGATSGAGLFNYTRAISAGSISPVGGTVNLLYWDDFNDNTTGAEATFPTGTGVATLTINYTVPSPATITWWDAPIGGNQLSTSASYETVGSTILPNTSTAGVYTFYAQGQNGACPSPGRTAATVTVNALPNINAGTDFAICLGQAVTLSGSGGSSYTWDNSVVNATAFNPTATNTYTVTGTDANGCISNDAIEVTVNALPTVSAGSDAAICIGGSIALNGSGSLSYTWDNSVVDGIVFSPTSTQTYTVTGTDANGCTNTDNTIITVNALPIVNAGVDQQVCTGSSVILSGSGATTYTWNNGVIDGTSFNPGSTASYTVTGTDANGCINTDLTIVTVNSLPNVNAGADFAVCQNGQAILSATGATTYAWNNGVTNNVSFALLTTGTYTVTGTDLNGCINTDDVTITANALPTVDAGSNIEQCGDQNVTLNGSGAVAYSWNNGVTDGTAFNSPYGTTAYILTGVDASGCSNTDIVLVTINAIPVATATAFDALTIIATPSNESYQWIDCSTNNPILGATSSTFTATANGSYAVIVTGEGGCSDTSACVIVDEVGFSNLENEISMTIYPNPTNGKLNVSLSSIDKVNIQVFDAQGKLIDTIIDAQDKSIIDLSNVEPGVYMIHMNSKVGTKINRVIKN